MKYIISMQYNNKILSNNPFKAVFGYLNNRLGEILYCFTVALLALWAIPGTIAIRHFLLLFGFIFSCLFLLKNWNLVKVKSAFPIYIFLTLFIWVIAHYLWIGVDQIVQFKELKSLWIRVFAAVTMAIACGIFIQQSQKPKKLLFLAFYTIPIFTILHYFYGSFKSNHFLLPNNFVGQYLINKINVAFMAVIGVSVSVAILIYGYMNKKSSNNRDVKWPFIGILICLVSAILASSKNGIGISVILLFLAIVYGLSLGFLRKSLKQFYWKPISVILVIIFLAGVFHSRFAAPGWSHLIGDIQISVQIEKYQNWKDTPKLGFPQRPDGSFVAGNTYERFAWGTKGIELIQKYPLGYGTINQGSFKHLLIRDGIPYPNNDQTHSGWIDFGMAFGIPGLLILFATLLSINICALKKKDSYSMLATWLSIAIFLACWVQEVSFKHTFEIWMFLIAFACALVIQVPKPANSELVPIE